MSLKDVYNFWGAGSAFISNQAVAADQELVAAQSGVRIVVDLLVLSCGTAAGTAFLESGTSTAITPVFNLGIGGNVVIYDPHIVTVRGQSLTLTSAGASSTVSCYVRYHLET